MNVLFSFWRGKVTYSRPFTYKVEKQCFEPNPFCLQSSQSLTTVIHCQMDTHIYEVQAPNLIHLWRIVQVLLLYVLSTSLNDPHPQSALIRFMALLSLHHPLSRGPQPCISQVREAAGLVSMSTGQQTSEDKTNRFCLIVMS